MDLKGQFHISYDVYNNSVCFLLEMCENIRRNFLGKVDEKRVRRLDSVH